MTLRQLEREIGVGEIADWIAHDELDFEARKSKQDETYDAGRALHRRI